MKKVIGNMIRAFILKFTGWFISSKFMWIEYKKRGGGGEGERNILFHFFFKPETVAEPATSMKVSNNKLIQKKFRHGYLHLDSCTFTN